MCMVFCKIIGKITYAQLPTDRKVPLFYPVPDPVESHVDCFGSSLFHTIVCNAFRIYIVCDNESGWLGIAEVHKSLAYVFIVLSIIEQCSQLGFGRGCEYVLHNGGKDVDHSVVGWCGRVGRRSAWVVGEEEISSCYRSSKISGEIQGVTVHMYHHVSCMESYGGVWVSSGIME